MSDYSHTSVNPATPTAPRTPGGILVNGIKAVGEVAIIPGVSLVADGDVKGGIVHAAAGLLIGAFFGPVIGALGWFGAAANSYSKSVTGEPIHQHFKRHRTV